MFFPPDLVSILSPVVSVNEAAIRSDRITEMTTKSTAHHDRSGDSCDRSTLARDADGLGMPSRLLVLIGLAFGFCHLLGAVLPLAFFGEVIRGLEGDG